MSSDENLPPPAGGCSKPHKGLMALLLLIFLAGAALRMFAPPAFKSQGHDEELYKDYVEILDAYTLFSYPKIVQYYNSDPLTTSEAQLPPTRFLYIFCGYCWDKLFYGANGDNSPQSQATSLDSLHSVSCLFSILTMPLAAFFAFRLGGTRIATGVLALIAFSPMQIYVAHHVLIDGFFAFWALLTIWLLWETLQRPGRYRWLAAYTLSIALMVLTKENAFFVYVAILGILVVNRWAKFGTVNPPLILCTFAGALLGAGGIVLLSGGIHYAVETYLLLVRLASKLPYAIETGDGPWHRYLCELLIMSPFVLLLAVGAVFRLGRENKAHIYLLCFVAFSYLIMCNVRYGMNLRYTNMWEMPLCFLAFWQLTLICENFGLRKKTVFVACMAVLIIATALFLISVPTLPFLTDFFREPVLLGYFYPWLPAPFILSLEILWAVCMSALVFGAPSLLFLRYETKILSLCIMLLCLCELGQYHLFFVQYHIYEPVPKELMRAVKIYVN